MKERLNLTVERDFKAKAAALAKKRRRSISALFEDLIEEEERRQRQANRVKESPETGYRTEQIYPT